MSEAERAKPAAPVPPPEPKKAEKAKSDKPETQLTRPTDQVDLEAFYAKEAGEDHEYNTAPGADRDFAVEGNDTSAYVGVSPEYRTYANEGERPFLAEDGVQKTAEDRAFDPNNFPVGKLDGIENNPSDGGTGSSYETVLPATSGDAVQSKDVSDRKPEDSGVEK